MKTREVLNKLEDKHSTDEGYISACLEPIPGSVGYQLCVTCHENSACAKWAKRQGSFYGLMIRVNEKINLRRMCVPHRTDSPSSDKQ